MATRSRKVFRGLKPPSRLEARFELLWRAQGGPDVQKEFRSDPVRKWRGDFAHLESQTLIEIEGGIYVNGRHNRGAGFAADLAKYLEATLAGWNVVRSGALRKIYLPPAIWKAVSDPSPQAVFRARLLRNP